MVGVAEGAYWGGRVKPIALLVSGGRGQLGYDLARLAPGPVRALPSSELDVTDVDSVQQMVGALAVAAADADFAPAVVNAAAYTAVDTAESDVDKAFSVNQHGAELLARVCAEYSVPLIQVSTDYVFAGDADRPYEPDDETGPRTVYGRSKLAGEQAVLSTHERAWVVRTSWLYGAGGANFVKTIIALEGSRETLSVVDDQLGSPTWSADLAAGLLQLVRSIVDDRGPRQRVLHCAGGGWTSWFGLARAVFEEIGADPERIRPCRSAEFPRPAPRPAYSVLSGASWRAAGLTPLRPWRQALKGAFAEFGAQLRAS